MPGSDFAQERQWLDRVYKELDMQLAQSRRDTQRYRDQLLEIRSSLRDDHGINSASANRMMDVAQRITELHHSGGHFGIHHEVHTRLQAVEKAPYFGRMDFHEDGMSHVEALYIGIRSLIDQESSLPLVYDWRAPVSSMFYDYGLGPAEYEGPGGMFCGEISLKRQYRIKNRELIYMFDNELKIDDEVLQAALGQHATEKMKTIVNTIQREQNQAIRNDNDDLLLVEGPAGSGKTSVALHRVAYLLYKYRDTFSSQNIMVFSPSKIFSDYISHVLPELGEDNTFQTTFQDYAELFLGWEWDVETQMSCLEYLLQSDAKIRAKRLQTIAYKSSQQFQKILENLIALIMAEASRFFDVKIGHQVVLSAQAQERLFNDSYSYLPINKRLSKIHQRVIFLLRPIKKQQRKRMFKEVQALPKYEDESWWQVAREAVRRVKQDLDPIMEKLRNHLQVDSVTWYTRLWQDMAVWEKVTGNSYLPQDGIDSLQSLERGLVSFEDVVPLLYLKGELEGYPLQREIFHVVVDEVQDYAPLQIQILTRTFPNAKFTFVGDVFQSLNPYIWQSPQTRLQDVFEEFQMGTVRLTKSYRSTREIFHFCNEILDGKSGAETVLRSGPRPIIYKIEKNEQSKLLGEQIEACIKADYQTIAVICPSVSKCQAIYHDLTESNPDLDISLLVQENALFKPGVIVVPVFLAKGLEFDAVILPEVDSKTYGQEYQRRLLYVACSRALHDLRLVYSGELSPFIRSLPVDLFRTQSE